MNKLVSLTVAMLCLVSFSAQARFGHRPGRHHRHLPPAVLKQIMKDAGLSDQQMQRIQTLHDELEQQQLDLKHELDKARLEMRQLMQQYQVDQGAAMAQVEKIGAVQIKLRKNHLRLRLQIRKEMSVEQWEKFRGLMAEKRTEFGKKFRKRLHKRLRQHLPENSNSPSTKP